MAYTQHTSETCNPVLQKLKAAGAKANPVCPPGPQRWCQRCFMELLQKHIPLHQCSTHSRQSLYPENTFMANRVWLMRQDG
ncbi:unnamed protein product [Menidia menidia]|uniref:(Atlantic silverside) hypothetical protein n=1 Tax=Menidia menidia TaxID=238744 RepID=A0A8S4B038_9TELE|nr:unnamed protein product [Menidia menidia]